MEIDEATLKWYGMEIKIGDFTLKTGRVVLYLNDTPVFGGALHPLGNVPLEVALQKLKDPTVAKTFSKIYRLFENSSPATRGRVALELCCFLLDKISFKDMARTVGKLLRRKILRERFYEIFAESNLAFRKTQKGYILVIRIVGHNLRTRNIILVTPHEARKTRNKTLASEIMFDPEPERRLKRLRKAEKGECERILTDDSIAEILRRDFPEAYIVLLSKALLEDENGRGLLLFQGKIQRRREG